MREFYARRRRREAAKGAILAVLSMLAAGVFFTMPMWMVILGWM